MAVAWIVARLAYWALYLADRSTARSTVWMAGYGLSLALLCSAVVQAQSNAAAPPAFVTERQVRLLVPYAPSGAVDISARILGKELSEIWAHPVVVDNRPGGAGVIAADMVSKAAGDGYTLLFTDDGVLTSMPFSQYSPSFGVSRQPMRFSNVVLPLPEGPTNETKEPGSMLKLAPFRAVTATSPIW